MDVTTRATNLSGGTPQPPLRITPASTLGSLPVALTSFVGREDEITLAFTLLQRPDLRLLTLNGPGGIGKTRLAVEIAARCNVLFPDGVAFVSLASVQDPAMVVAAVAAAIGPLDVSGTGVADNLALAIGASRLLLVVDNFEHVLDAAPALTRLIARCPHLKIVVTSRSLLRVEGEHALPVPPLGLPDVKPTMSDDDWLQVPVIKLFIDRARAVSPATRWSHLDIRHVIDICARLDGLPLAVELAATRVRHLTLEEMRDQLNQSLPLLIGGSRDHPTRLQTMRNAIGWSHDLLTPESQIVLRRVAVFTGGFSLDAAEHVVADASLTATGGEAIERSSVFDGLATLIDASLLQTDLLPDGQARYRLLETIREFSLERLRSNSETSAVRRAHANYFLALAERYELTDLLPGGDHILFELKTEHANLRAALTWLAESGEYDQLARLSVALGRFWADQGYYDEGSRWLQLVVAPDSSATATERAKALMHLGMMEAFQRPDAAAESRLTAALAGCIETGAAFNTAMTRILLGWLVNQRGDSVRGRMLLEQALADSATLTDRRLSGIVAAWALANLAEVARMGDDRALALEHLEAALLCHRDIGYAGGMILILKDLGELARDQADYVRALGFYREALAQVQGSPGTRVVTEVIDAMGVVAIALGHVERGVRLMGAAEAQRERIGLRFRSPVAVELLEPTITSARAALGESSFATVWSAGRLVRPEQAVAEALEPFEPAKGPSISTLTPREAEVLRLVADGQTDPDIAAMLFLSVRTVENHVSHIFAKLGVRTRTAAVTAALASGLISPVSPRLPQPAEQPSAL